MNDLPDKTYFENATIDPLARVLNNRRPLSPLPTSIEPRLQRLQGITTVLLDVYGTLVISGSGDVGTAQPAEQTAEQTSGIEPSMQPSTVDRVRQAGAAVGLPDPETLPTAEQLRDQIVATNEASRSTDHPKPEVEILDVWRTLLAQSGRDDVARQPRRVAALAAEYESLANPTWPMPGAVDAVAALADRGVHLGIVSNAQTFTIPLVEDFLGAPLDRYFGLNLCFFSNRFRAAKPGPRLFDELKAGLRRLDVSSEQAIYIGNDMLNDVWAASQAGFRTALFAGDARSLRLRRDHPDCATLSADLVLTDWNQIVECLG